MISHADVGANPERGPVLHGEQFEKSIHNSVTGLLTHSQRLELARTATKVRVPSRSIVYREDAELSSIYIGSRGVLKAFRELPNGKRRVSGFLFPGDMFGLAEKGRYMNTVQAVTNAAVYRIPIHSLRETIRHDPQLQFHFLCKVHELRQGQHHAIVLGRRDAPGRVAMFLRTLERHLQPDKRTEWIPLPMNRTDIAEYLGLSVESVSRAMSALKRRGIITFEHSHAVKVTDRPRFDRLAGTL